MRAPIYTRGLVSINSPLWRGTKLIVYTVQYRPEMIGPIASGGFALVKMLRGGSKLVIHFWAWSWKFRVIIIFTQSLAVVVER